MIKVEQEEFKNEKNKYNFFNYYDDYGDVFNGKCGYTKFNIKWK